MKRVLPWLALAACGAPVETSSEAPDTGVGTQGVIGGVEIAPNVTVLDRSTAAAAIVGEDSVTFAGNMASRLKAGGYIVSGEGDGFIRRIEAVEGDVVRTKQAKLTDVIRRGSIHTELELDPVDLDLSSETTVKNVKLTVSPLKMTVQPRIRLDLEIDGGDVKDFSSQMTLERVTQIGLRVEAGAENEAFATGDIALWRSPKWRFTQMIGPIPVVEVVQIVVGTGVKGHSTAIGVVGLESACSHAYTYSLAYQDGEFFDDSTGEDNCDALVPTFSGKLQADATAYLKGTLSVDFYGIAGPYVALSDGVRADLLICPAPGNIALSSPLELAIGADLSKLGGKKYEKTLFTHSIPIKEWDLDTALVCSVLP